MRTRSVLVTVFAAVLVTAWLSGCKTTAEEPSAPAPAVSEETPSVAPDPTRSEVRVYFIRGEKVGVAGREITAAEDAAAIARLTLEKLLEGPSTQDKEFGLETAIPLGTTVNGVEIDAGVATVDLSGEYVSGGGSLSMHLRVAQVVCTLTQFDDIRKVAFEIDGKSVNAIGGEGVMVSPPVGRADFEDQLPAILVETPVPGAAVTSPLTISGTSNVFEATHQLTITDPDGLIVVEEFVTATSGTGTRGTWSATVEYPLPKFDGMGSVIVYTLSAKDGKKTDIVEIPVRMTK